MFVVIIAIGFLCRVLFAIFTPTFYAPDEQAHFKYIDHIAQNRSLPILTSQVILDKYNCEYIQPPLYYIIMSPLYALSKSLGHNDTDTVHILRFYSIFLWCITIWMTLRIIERLNISDEFIKTFIIAMMSLLPSYVFISSVINNDNLLYALGSIFIYFFISNRFNILDSIIIGLLLGLTLLTKLNGLGFVVMTVVILVKGLIRPKENGVRLTMIIVSLTLASVLFLPWILRNWNLYGSFTPMNILKKVSQWDSVFHAIKFTGSFIFTSFWSVSGIFNNVCANYPRIGKLISLFASIGILWGFFIKRDRLKILLSAKIDVIAAFAVAILIILILVFRFGVLYDQGQGRHFFGLLIPISFFMAGGLRVFSITDSRYSHIIIAGIMSIYAVSFTFYSLERFNWLVRNEPAPVSVTESDFDSPSSFSLLPSYPNPFNSTTTISYGLPYPGSVSLQVYNLSGQRMTTLFNGYRQPGIHSTTLTADDLASGLYFVRLEGAGEVATRKVMLIR